MERGKTPDEDEVDTLLSEAGPAPARAACAYRISVLEGPDRGKEFSLDENQPSRALIGKGPACTLKLSDPLASRRHAALDIVDGHVRIIDLDSTNGTFVSGLRVMDAFLRDGEVVRIGGSTLRMDRLAEAGSLEVSKLRHFGSVVGASLEMRRLYPLFEKIAASDVPVLIEGETGTGKEALAESLHEQGPRSAEPFIVFDCTEVPPSLVESELFGHERGAFTGATTTRRGVFELAHKGTLFIDELGELSPDLQPKLLRAVERTEVRRLGGDRRIPVDVRLIAASRRDLDRDVQDGRFRDDLFFRLAVTRVELPPLRSRRGDIGVLARHFWKTLGAEGELPYDLLQQLESYRWPGNVRELRNAVARRLALGDLSQDARCPDPPSEPQPAGDDAVERVLKLNLAFPHARQRILRDFERRYVERVLAQHGGNVTHAARASGIARRYLNVIRARQVKPRGDEP